MVQTANLGFPRIGAGRELKTALEAYWRGELDKAGLAAEAMRLRAEHWQVQRAAGIDVLPSNDFSLYDHVLDITAMLGAVPPRFGEIGNWVNGALYFAMARGTDRAPAMEMTKWFDTNYHYIVPELHKGQSFRLATLKPIEEYLEAAALGFETRPVLLGPLTWLLLGKSKDGVDPLSLLPAVTAVYEDVLQRLAQVGAQWVQIDEPILATDLPQEALDALASLYARLAACGPRLMLASYFGTVGNAFDTLLKLPVAGLHFDLVRAPEQAERLITADTDKLLSLGVIDGRNIWKADLNAILPMVKAVAERHGGRVQLAPSCSLLHSPVDLARETGLDAELKQWLAFAKQKLDEVCVLARAVNEGEAAVSVQLQANATAMAARRTSPRIHDAAVKDRAARVSSADLSRQSHYADRAAVQAGRFGLPRFPTTTIGSFPQTVDVRHARAEHRKGRLSDADYEVFLREKTADCIGRQEAIGLDVLVHGEFERNDMVEYFGEQLAGFAFTRAGWVQSYGSRCVKPPIVYGDVSRPRPMTVDWSVYAQSLTKARVKGMLTGPVTILQWSFVRDDQPRSETCRQIALAIRDEVHDLEAAGIAMIQVDEPALREGLPLRKQEQAEYLQWAVDAFRLASTGVADETQIHTHMCYAEFSDIMQAVVAMDADVISIETSRSAMELLNDFGTRAYPAAIGPGIWDIHAPRVPTLEEMAGLLRKATAVIPEDRLWVNPDCGLKTRGWPEVEGALRNLVATAQALRSSLATAA